MHCCWYFIYVMDSKFTELVLSDVEDTGEELGRGSYGIVTKVNVKGLVYVYK